MMDKFKRLIMDNRGLMTGLGIFFILSAFFLILNPRGVGFLELTPYHGPFLNSFFTYFTNLGDGLFSIFLVVILLVMRKIDFALQILIAFLISGLFTQVLKGLITSPRPRDFFSVADSIYIIEGVTLGGKASFPSGHTASAFALAVSLSLYSGNKFLNIIYLLLAIGVGYSRIYLSQHFPGDVFGGAVIGVLVAIWVYLFMEKYNARIMRRAQKNRVKSN
ncbi:MAG: phosphatase PAP2 family protein [Chitinophagales bacterium]